MVGAEHRDHGLVSQDHDKQAIHEGRTGAGVLALFLILIVTYSGRAAGAEVAAPESARPRDGECLLQPLDLVTLWVYRLPELSMELRVSPAGDLTLPVVGKLKAAGRRPEDIAAEVREGLASRLQLQHPQIALIVKEYAPQYAYIHGGVRQPKDVLLPRDRALTLSQAVAMAGGLTEDAAPAKVRVVRSLGADGRLELTVDLLSFMGGGRPELDLPLVAGDSVYVPQERNGIFVVGGVVKPGYVDLTSFAAPHRGWQPITASQALSLAGGLQDGALASRARVLRAKEGESAPQVIPVDLEALIAGRAGADARLAPGDTLFVPYGQGVFVLGSVEHGGQVFPPPGGPLTVTKAISMAGGFARLASPGSVRLIRPDGVVQVDVEKITKSDPRADPVLAPGDIVYVPRGL